jgi:ABC-2 type transport system ATP-binding protein
MTVVRVTGLSRRFGVVQAVRGVSFEIAGGEVLGLLGPNGAGKTTVVDCVLGLTPADGGAITICGEAAGSIAARASTGAVLQATGLQDKITPREALHLYSQLSFPSPGPRFARPEDKLQRESNFLLDRFGLRDKADAPYDTLSGGQKQRLALALAFLGDPRLLVLDEPTSGLDVAARATLHADIRTARDEGRAILLTTHDMAEARDLCDRVAVMEAGAIVRQGAPGDVL